MDDLLNADWNAPQSTTTAAAKPYNNPLSSYPGLRPSPSPSLSNLPTPQHLSRPSSALNATKGPFKAPSPANDSFSNLLSLNANKPTGSLSLQERQKQLLAEKKKQEEEQRARYAAQFGASDARIWDNLGSGKATPEPRIASPAIGSARAAATRSVPDDEDDILAAFNSAAPVDKSSHFPPPTLSAGASGRSTPVAPQSNARVYAPTNHGNLMGGDDDDPFGLGAMPQRNAASSQPTAASANDDDDILGDLGKPVTAKPPPKSSVDEAFNIGEPEVTGHRSPDSDPLDPATAELVDMGFPVDRSRLALEECGGNVQAAVGWLLNQAHEESKQKSRGDGTPRAKSVHNDRDDARSSSQRRGRGPADSSVPTWMRQESRPSSGQRRQGDDSSVAEKDVAQYASEIGSSLFKSANSLWKTGQKRVQKVVAEFQVEDDPTRPKWMRDASTESQRSGSQRPPDHAIRDDSRPSRTKAVDLTDEAMMLDMDKDRSRPPPRKDRASDLRNFDAPQDRRVLSPAPEPPSRPHSQPKFTQQQPQQDKRPATKLSRQDVEEQSAQAYISPARRKRPVKPSPQPEPEVDLFSPAPTQPTITPQPSKPTPARPTASSPALSTAARIPTASIAIRPAAPRRNIPTVSSSALSKSASHRKSGTEAFKRGDYDAAHISYIAALEPLPPTHPLTIIVLSNCALTAIKTGDPKAAVAHADQALTVIGPSRGEGEKIDVGAGEGEKDMKDFYGKALMRKAEALEHMEKWSDAAKIWKDAVEAGVGGAVSLRARDRCEKAAGGGSATPAVRPQQSQSAAPVVKKAANKTSALRRPAAPTEQSAEAVRKLREANAAAEKADVEKFALVDQVDARLTAWKGGKSDNLRALLGSLDTVLWPEAGWKKVGMSDLIIPGKVKIIYMKAIAKVHPDKISQTATTEQRMISGSVFSTLNEAWDKFKKDNGL
ncbi:hypothetical protein MBLNU459_g3142t2 [Dothideomycetes sp. NU459]